MSDGGCAFCGIASGEIPAPIVYDDDATIAFLDHRPVFIGHTLLISRTHHETLPDLPQELLAPFFGAARILAAGVRDAMDAHGTFMAINNTVSQSVPHVHMHVVPRRRKDGLRGFFWPRTTYADDEQRESVRAAIASAVRAVRSSGM